MACGIDQLSRATRARIQGPTVLTRCHGQLRTVPEGPGVEQLSRESHACVRGSPGYTICRGGLGPVPDFLRG